MAGETPALQLQSSSASLDNLNARPLPRIRYGSCLPSDFSLIPSRSTRTVASGVRRTYGMSFRFRMSGRRRRRLRHGFSLRRASDKAETETSGAHDQIENCFHIGFF